MKKIISNKVYDTATAREIGSNSYSYFNDFNYWCETLYCKRTGEYFIHGEGGPNSRYAERIDQNSWSGGQKIIPVSYENAREWAEKNLEAEEYEAEFGTVTEDETAETLTISLPAATIAKLRRSAQENGTSLSKLIASLIEKAV